MNQEHFEAACTQAIAPYHDTAQDGPLLVALRMNATKSVLQPGTIIIYPEYAAVLGEWPKPTAHPYGGLNDHGPVYHESPKEAITALATAARDRWAERGGDNGAGYESEPEATLTDESPAPAETSCEFEARAKGR